MNALVPINQHEAEPIVPYAVRLSERHLERRERWAALAVRDDPIMLRPYKDPEESWPRLPAPVVRSLPIDPAVAAANALVAAAVEARYDGVQMKTVIAFVAAAYGIPVQLLKSKLRCAHLVRPRQVSAYLCHLLSHRSLVQIGKTLGDRDHTTILHAYRKIKALTEADPGFAVWVECLKARLEETRVPGAASPQLGAE